MDIWEELQPSFFEVMFLLALTVFRDAEVDVVVLETGMGGRLDSTNIFSAPLVTAITSIGLDHQQFLGPDLRSIASEKAGILKEGVPCVLGILPPEARSVVLEHSMRLGVEVYDGLLDPTPPAGPNWLQRNRAVARRVLSLLPGGLQDSDEPVLQAGPAAWGLRGRWHQVGADILLDCAHNVEGLTATGMRWSKLGALAHRLRHGGGQGRTGGVGVLAGCCVPPLVCRRCATCHEGGAVGRIGEVFRTRGQPARQCGRGGQRSSGRAARC